MDNQQTNTVQSSDKKTNHLWVIHLARPLAILFWLYAVTQVFVYDVDLFLESRLPAAAWAIRYKFSIIVGIIALIWLFTKSIELLLWFIYISLYPIIVLIWTIPRFVYKQKSWNLTIAYVNTVLSTSKSLKYGVLTFALILIETTLILESTEPLVLWLAVGLCIFTLVSAFFHRIVLIFKPSTLYEAHTKLTSSITKFGKKVLSVENSIKELPSDTMLEMMTVPQKTAWANSLQFAIILNRGCKFLSRKIEDYQRSRLTALFYALNFLMLTVVSIFMFSLINYGLYKIDPHNYVVSTKPNFFIFFFYSANTLWGHGINEIVASANMSRAFFLCELFFTFLLVVILITLGASVKNEREADEIKKTITTIRSQGEEMRLFIREQYGLSIEDAINRLIAANLAGLINIINFLSIDDDKNIPANEDDVVQK